MTDQKRRPRVPTHLKRMPLAGRVLPRTLAYLESFGEPNMGRAVDRLVEAHRSIMRAMRPELKGSFEQLAKLPLDERK